MEQPENYFDDSFFGNLLFDTNDNYPMATNDINFSQSKLYHNQLFYTQQFF